MATQAIIEINGSAGSNTDLPLGVLVNLANIGAGGETTWEWTLISQPEGTQNNFQDSGTLVSTLAAPKFTPTKEGSYLIRLVVNKGLVDEKTDTVIGAVLELQTGNRIPAALETTEVDNTYGWSYSAVNDILQRVTRLTDSGTFVCIAGETLAPGDVVHMTEMTTIAAGLPGERKLPKVMKASATTLLDVDGPLGVMVGQKNGDYLSVTTGAYCRVMTMGGLSQITLAGGPGVAGDPIYVDNSGKLSLTPGTYIRQVADVAKVYPGPVYDVSVAAVANSIPRGNALGDLSGYYPNPTVAKINGTTIATAGGGLATGAVLRATLGATADWGAVDLTNDWAVTNILPIRHGGTNNMFGGTAGSVAYFDGTAYNFTATGTAGYLLKSTGSGAPSWLQTVPPANGGTGSTTVPNAGDMLYGNGGTYTQLAAGSTSQILVGGTTPSWGTVPTAAFAADSIPFSAIADVRVLQNVNLTYSNTTTSFTGVATVTLTISPGNATFNITPQSDGSTYDAWLTTASTNTSATGELRYTVTGPAGFSTLTYVQRQRSATAHNNNQVTGAVIFPTYSFNATVAGSYTVLVEARVLTAGDTISISNYQLRLRQG